MVNAVESSNYSTASAAKLSPSSSTRSPLTPNLAHKTWKIAFITEGEPVISLRLEIASPVLVGRADPVENHMPGLDLEPYGARDAGVSRRHAMLYPGEDGLMIRDLGSTNGTRVNGLLLDPKQAYLLSENDKIEIGRMQFALRLFS